MFADPCSRRRYGQIPVWRRCGPRVRPALIQAGCVGAPMELGDAVVVGKTTAVGERMGP